MSPQKHQRTGNQALVREINLSAIMNRLHKHAPISRAALAEITGLNKTTVSSLIQELLELQFVREVGLEAAGTGRPAILLELNPTAGYMVSAEIGVDFIAVMGTNFAIEPVWQHKESTKPELGQQAILDRSLTLLRQAVEVGRDLGESLLGLAVGVPGLVDQRDGTILFAPNLRWQNVPLRDILHQTFDTRIFVDNEANLATLGEYYFGAAQGYHEVLYVSAGVGLGGGVIHNGQLFNGGTGLAGEFGHMTMDPEGKLCNCGNRGCWETQASQSALFRYVQQAINKEELPGILSEQTEGNLDRLSVSLVVDAAKSNDAVALAALNQVGHYLGIGIASLVNALNPELIVFGGILSLAGEFLLPIIHEQLEQRALRWSETAVEVVLAQHGPDSCVMGGIATIYQSILSHPGKIFHK
jgi:glucokinase-like ROK family protein